MFFATHYVRGLREDIRAVVEPQVPSTMEKAVIIAKIQQKVIDHSKLKFNQNRHPPKVQHAKLEAKPPKSMAVCGGISNLGTTGRLTTFAMVVGRSMSLAMLNTALKELNLS